MRWFLMTLAVLWLPMPSSVQAQVLELLPAINDSDPQMIYTFFGGGTDYLGVKSAVEIDVPDVRFRALTNYYELGGWGAAQDATAETTSLYRCDPWVSGFSPQGWDPIPYQIEGLAYIPESDRLIACAWDGKQNSSIILEIDEDTGAFQPLGTLAVGLRFSGLAYSFFGLAGVTRDLQTDASAIYRIDMSTWSIEHVVDLPAPCEALAVLDSGYPGWFAAGERIFHVLGTEVVEWPVVGGAPGSIVAMGDWFGFSAVEPVTWGAIKRQYR